MRFRHHFQFILASFWSLSASRFQYISDLSFWLVFGWFGGQFYLHFDFENLSRRRPEAKWLTFDFEQPSTQNQRFQLRRVPGETQNASRKRAQKGNTIFIDLAVKIASQIDLKEHHFGTQNA